MVSCVYPWFNQHVRIQLPLVFMFGVLFGAAGEMLHVAEAFIEKNYHPTVICRGNVT